MQSQKAVYEEKVVDLQWRSMRQNLIFTGISEPELPVGEYEDVCYTLRRFLREQMHFDRDIEIERVHRLGRPRYNQRYPRPIIAKFQRYRDKEEIRLAAPKRLYRTHYGVREQFPSEIEEKRKELYPIAKEFRQNRNNVVRLVRDKLYVNGKEVLADQRAPEKKIGVNENRYRGTDRRLGDESGLISTPYTTSGKKKTISPIDSENSAKKRRGNQYKRPVSETPMDTQQINESSDSESYTELQFDQCNPLTKSWTECNENSEKGACKVTREESNVTNTKSGHESHSGAPQKSWGAYDDVEAPGNSNSVSGTQTATSVSYINNSQVQSVCSSALSSNERDFSKNLLTRVQTDKMCSGEGVSPHTNTTNPPGVARIEPTENIELYLPCENTQIQMPHSVSTTEVYYGPNQVPQNVTLNTQNQQISAGTCKSGQVDVS